MDNKKPPMSFEQAIEMGEYDPKYLSQYPEWQTMSRYVQFEHVRKALDNRHKQLVTHYAELSNTLDLSKKPQVHEALKNLEDQLHQLLKEKERLYIEYSM